MAKIPKDGSTVDLQPLFFQLTLDSATEFLFGESVHSLTAAEGSEQDNFGKAFDYAQSKLGPRARTTTIGRFFETLKPDVKFNESCATVHKFVDKIIGAALEKARLEAQNPEKNSEEGGSGRYVFLHEMIKQTQDPKVLRDELLNILLAGRDTTASLLSHTFHVLARRPDIWKKLSAEVAELQGERPDWETMKNMKFLKYLLTECKLLSILFMQKHS